VQAIAFLCKSDPYSKRRFCFNTHLICCTFEQQ